MSRKAAKKLEEARFSEELLQYFAKESETIENFGRKTFRQPDFEELWRGHKKRKNCLFFPRSAGRLAERYAAKDALSFGLLLFQ